MKTAYHFFLSHAGYSYNPATQTPMQGRIQCAQELARAEKAANNAGVSFNWEYDDIDSSDFSDDPDTWQLWQCTAYDADGQVIDSLCGVDFGRDGTPWGNPYRRVCEAEMASEFISGE